MEDITTHTHFEGDGPATLLTENAKKYLKSTSGWALFLAICMFVLTGLLIIAGLALLFVTSTPKFGAFEAIIPILYLIVLPALYIWLGTILFRFYKHSKSVSLEPTSENLEQAFKYLKYYFTFLGVMVIVVVFIYLVGILLLGIGGLSYMSRY